MSLIISRYSPAGRKAFSLVELLTASFVALYVIAASWSVYMMVSRWWYETGPKIEVQRIARVALLSIVEGAPDPTTGTFTFGATTYKRRNGIAWAIADPTIGADTKTISYRLEPDASNVRRFYLGTDAASGLGAVYYRDSSSIDHEIRPTIGITDLKFETVAGYNNMIKVTATAEKVVTGTRQASYKVSAQYSDVVYLRNDI